MGLSEPSWEREINFQLSRTHILPYWTSTPDQHRQTNRLYRRMRIGAAQGELSRNNGERFLAPGYACVPRAEWLRRYRDTVLPKRAHYGYKGNDRLWWLRKISASTTEDGVHLVRFWTTRGRSSFLSPRRATRPQRGPYEILAASRSTKPARSVVGFNVTEMNLEARPWLADFHTAPALDSFPFFWVFILGLFLAFSAFLDPGFSPWVVSGVLLILSSGFGVFLV